MCYPDKGHYSLVNCVLLLNGLLLCPLYDDCDDHY